MNEMATPRDSLDNLYSNDGENAAPSPLPFNDATPNHAPALISSTQTPHRDSQLLSPLSSSLNNTATRLSATDHKEYSIKPPVSRPFFTQSRSSGGSAEKIRRSSESGTASGLIIPPHNAGTTENELYNTPAGKASQPRAKFDALRIERTPTSSTAASGEGSCTRPPQSIASSGGAQRARQESFMTGGSLPATATERSNPAVALEDDHAREARTDRLDANTDTDAPMDQGTLTQAASENNTETSRFEMHVEDEDLHSPQSIGAPINEEADHGVEELFDSTRGTANNDVTGNESVGALQRGTWRPLPATQLSASRSGAESNSNLRMHPALLSHTPPRKLSRRARARSNDVRKGSIMRDGQPLIPTPLPTHRANGTTIEFVALSSTGNGQRSVTRGNAAAAAARANDDDDDPTTFDVWTVSERGTHRSRANSDPKSGRTSQEASSQPHRAHEGDEDTLFLELTDDDGSARFNDTANNSRSASKRTGASAGRGTSALVVVPASADAAHSHSVRTFGAGEETTTELIMSFGSSTHASGTFRKSGSRGHAVTTSGARQTAQPAGTDIMEEELNSEEVPPDTSRREEQQEHLLETEKDSYVTVNPSSSQEAPAAMEGSASWRQPWTSNNYNSIHEVRAAAPKRSAAEKTLGNSRPQAPTPSERSMKDAPQIPKVSSEREREQLELLRELEKELTEFEECLSYGSDGVPMSILAHISASREDELRILVQQRVKARTDEVAVATRDCELAEREYKAARARLLAHQTGSPPQQREGRHLSRSSTWQRGNSPDACPNISTRHVNLFVPLASFTSATSRAQSSTNGGASRIVVPASPVFSWQETSAITDTADTSGNRPTRGRSRQRTLTTPRRGASLEQSLVEEKKRLHQQNAELRFHLRRGTNYKNSAALRMSTPLRRNAAPTRDELVKLQLELSTIQAANRKAAEEHHNLTEMLRDLRHGGDGSGNSSQDEIRKYRLQEEETDLALKLNHLREEQSLLQSQASSLRRECLNRGEDGYAWMIANALRDYELVSASLKQQVAAMLGETREGSLPQQQSTPVKRLASRGALNTPPQLNKVGHDSLVRTPTRRSELGGFSPRPSPRKTRAMSADSLKRLSTPTTASRIYAEERAKARREVEGRHRSNSTSKRWQLAFGSRPLLN